MHYWSWQKWAVFLAPAGLIVLGMLIVLALRNTLRSRFRMQQQLAADPDIIEYLVVYNWSDKILYLPMILASLLAATIMYIAPQGDHSRVVAAIWLTIFFLNFIVDEYEINIKVLIIFVLCVIVLFLWLSYLDWVAGFINLFRNFDATMNGTTYLVIGLIFLAAVGVSWLRGLFYYVTITPNYLNIKSGPTDTDELINRENFSIRTDSSDFLERLLGFGKIVITFTDHSRTPLILLVGRIGQRTAKIEALRGKLAVEHHAPGVNA